MNDAPTDRPETDDFLAEARVSVRDGEFIVRLPGSGLISSGPTYVAAVDEMRELIAERRRHPGRST